MLRRTPLEPPRAVPKTFYLPDSHVDKCDISGLPYYPKVDPKTGIPDLSSPVSMTPEAINARNKYRAGPKMTAEERAKFEAKQEKLKAKLGEDYRKQKDEQRKQIREREDRDERRTLAQYEKDRVKDKKAFDERRKTLDKDIGPDRTVRE